MKDHFKFSGNEGSHIWVDTIRRASLFFLALWAMPAPAPPRHDRSCKDAERTTSTNESLEKRGCWSCRSGWFGLFHATDVLDRTRVRQLSWSTMCSSGCHCNAWRSTSAGKRKPAYLSQDLQVEKVSIFNYAEQNSSKMAIFHKDLVAF